MLTATFLINRQPSSSIRGETPYAKLFEKPTNYQRLKAFGCLAFSSMGHLEFDRFGPTSKQCVFMGYPANQKTYRLYEIDIGRVFTSRDVVFLEHISRVR